MEYNGISHYKQSVFRRDIQFIDKPLTFGSINFSQEKKTLVKERTNKEFLNKRDRTIF